MMPEIKDKPSVRELRVKFRSPEDRTLYDVFVEICEMTQRDKRKVVLALLDQWVREEGGKIYGEDSIAKQLESL